MTLRHTVLWNIYQCVRSDILTAVTVPISQLSSSGMQQRVFW